MVAGVLRAGPRRSTPFGNVTAAFTHTEWGHSVPAPRHRCQEETPEKSRNLVQLVSQPGMNSQLEQRESPWMLRGEGLRSTCPVLKWLHRNSPVLTGRRCLNHCLSQMSVKNHPRTQGHSCPLGCPTLGPVTWGRASARDQSFPQQK